MEWKTVKRFADSVNGKWLLLRGVDLQLLKYPEVINIFIFFSSYVKLVLGAVSVGRSSIHRLLPYSRGLVNKFLCGGRGVSRHTSTPAPYTYVVS